MALFRTTVGAAVLAFSMTAATATAAIATNAQSAGFHSVKVSKMWGATLANANRNIGW